MGQQLAKVLSGEVLRNTGLRWAPATFPLVLRSLLVIRCFAQPSGGIRGSGRFAPASLVTSHMMRKRFMTVHNWARTLPS